MLGFSGEKGFSGDPTNIDFTVGAVQGTRSFKVNYSGKLTGVTFDNDEWADGENVASCPLEKLHEIDQKSRRMLKQIQDITDNIYRNKGEEPPELEPEPEIESGAHEMKDCGHGFWAYFNKKNNYGVHKTIPGVIEGYGEVIIGEKGFRSSKARILGLVEPDTTWRGLVKSNASWFIIAMGLVYNLLVVTARLFSGFFGTVDMSVAVEGAIHMLLPIGLSIFCLILVSSSNLLVSFRDRSPSFKEALKASSFGAVFRSWAKQNESFDKMRDNYPNVELYSSREEMLKAFPRLRTERKRWVA